MKTKRSENSPTGSVRAVERALDILMILQRFGQPVSLTEISLAVGLHKATTQRLLTTVERRGFVQKERGLYQLGLSILPLAQTFLSGNNLIRSALPVLEELTAITDETSSLYVRQDDQRVLIQRVESTFPLRFTTRIGERLPVYSGATGQVLCATMPDDQLRQMLDRVGDVIQLANGKILTKEEMYARLEEVRRQGFAVSTDERLIGVTSVAAPIVHPNMGVIAAVVVTGPSARITPERIHNLSEEVRRAAREIAERYCQR
jgi:DNA-binding IclR family transcriptional regulator